MSDAPSSTKSINWFGDTRYRSIQLSVKLQPRWPACRSKHFHATSLNNQKRKRRSGANEPEPPPVHFFTSISPPSSCGRFPRVPGHKRASKLTRPSPQTSVHVVQRLHLAGLGSRLVEKPAAHASFVLSPGRLGGGHGAPADLVACLRHVFVAARVVEAEQIV